MIKTEFMKLLEELDSLNEATDSVDAILAEIEAGAKALLQDSPITEDIDIDNNDIDALQVEADKDWKKSQPWIERVKTWFAEKVLKVILKNEKVYDALITNQFEGNRVESYLVDITYDLQQIHWDQIEDIALKNAAKKGKDISGLALKVISKENWYSQEKFFVKVLELIRAGGAKDIYDAVRKLDLALFDYQLVPKHLLESSGLTEATDINSSKKFWAAAKNKQIDEVSFHAAYDDELTELGLMDIFTTEGIFTSRGVYGRIKEAKDANPDSWAIKALSKLWALRYVDNVQFPSEVAAEETRRAEYEKRRAEEERLAKEKKEAQLQEYNDLVKASLDKVDPQVVAAYEQIIGGPASENIYLDENSRSSAYGLHFKGWEYYYPLSESKLKDETKLLKLLTEGCVEATKAIRIKAGTAKFKALDVFRAHPDATVILRGESGTLYELTGNYRGTLMVSVNGGAEEPADIITEPYEIIYTRTHWSDHNHYTTRDSHGASYYSWNSKYEAELKKLGRNLPTKFGRVDGYIGSYTETKKIENPSSDRYSHADGIDTWVEVYGVAGATD